MSTCSRHVRAATAAAARKGLSREAALALALEADTAQLCAQARILRDAGHANLVSYSRKVFLPLTQLCRDVCHYCTFAQTPRQIDQPYMSVESVLQVARQGEQLGCKEALFTLGERPELRYRAARDALHAMGFDSTLDYVTHAAAAVLQETTLLPHINAGCMSREEMQRLKAVSASMGIMLESASTRLCNKGMPHHGSPDKLPARRLETLRIAGELQVPFTTGILIGIGETRLERIEALLAIRELHEQYGHIQEIIVQNFRAKPGTRMAQAPEPDLEELLWSIAVARMVFGPHMSIQAPPNLSPGVLPQLVNAGLNDWGGVSPLTPDFVNPEAPWPELEKLTRQTRMAGKHLHERLTVYPQYATGDANWLDPLPRKKVLGMIDTEGFARTDSWSPGDVSALPAGMHASQSQRGKPSQPASTSHTRIPSQLEEITARASAGERLPETDIEQLFAARGDAFDYVCKQADALRQRTCGDAVAFVVNRNINYTNICYFKCQFCAFSKGKRSENLRGKPYNLPLDEIARRASEAWSRGATEVCLQGGIHPDYTGQTYIDIVHAVKSAVPDMHVHAFSPLEIWQGASTLGLSLREFLTELKSAGLGSLPGTAAEILDDEVRELICPDKINTRQWLDVMRTAHEVGLRSTSTIMFGHVDRYRHWARHLLRIRDLQEETGGFTEFVPLPFVHLQAPVYLKGKARKGPTLRESMLMHAVARLALHTHINNIQVSWVKMGKEGSVAALAAGANDMGGTLMNESISRAAGAAHGQELAAQEMRELILRAGRKARQRTTLYTDAVREQVIARV